MLGCVGGVSFLLLASAWIPFFGPFLGLLIPLPFLYYSTKLGFYQGVKIAALATLIIGLVAGLIGHPQIVLLSVELGALGLVLSELFRRKLRAGQTIFFGTVFMLLLTLFFLFFMGLSKDMGPLEIMLDYLQSNLEAAIKTYKEMGVSQEDVVELQALAKAFMDGISRFYPSIMIISAGFAVWLNFVMAKPLFWMGKLEYPDFGPLDRWQTPDYLIWGVILSGFASLLSSGGIKLLAINALIVFSAVYLFHGISIILFFLNKYRVPPWIRISIYFIVFIQQLFLVVLVIAGVFDQWVDFRKIKRITDS